MVCPHTYSFRRNGHPGGEALSGSSDPLAFYTTVVSISQIFLHDGSAN
jgi:hypothetical protein